MRKDYLKPLYKSLKNQTSDPQSRRVLLAYAAAFWYLGWSVWMVISAALDFLPTFQVMAFGLLAMLIGSLTVWSMAGDTSTGLRASAVFAGFSLVWIVVTYATTVWANNWLFTWFIGSVLTLVAFLAALPLPLWHISINRGEVYMDLRKGVREPLKSRPPIVIDTNLQTRLLQAGLPYDLLHRFLDYDAPDYMRELLTGKMQPGSQPLLEELYQQAREETRQPKAEMWVSAVDNVFLFWKKTDSLEVDLPLEQVITDTGSPVKINVKFNFSFDPEAIQYPEFRASLPNWKTDTLKEFLIQKMKATTEKITRHFFVLIPLQSALTRGSINQFREFLPSQLTWTRDSLGISVKSDTVQCRPVVYETVEQAEIDMIASRAKAQSETAKLQALLDQVMLSGVPPKLLTGLLMADSGIDNLNYSTRGGDMLDLPEADPLQKEQFYVRKYGFPQGRNVPPLPGAPASSPSPAPPPQPQPPNTQQANGTPKRARRRAININKRLTMRRGQDGIYRAGKT